MTTRFALIALFAFAAVPSALASDASSDRVQRALAAPGVRAASSQAPAREASPASCGCPRA